MIKPHKPQINCLIIMIVECLKRKKEVPPHVLFTWVELQGFPIDIMTYNFDGNTHFCFYIVPNFIPAFAQFSFYNCVMSCNAVSRSQSLWFLRCTLNFSYNYLQTLWIVMMATRRCTLWMLATIFKRQPITST